LPALCVHNFNVAVPLASVISLLLLPPLPHAARDNANAAAILTATRRFRVDETTESSKL
jgi:hypothetical protein